MSNDRHGEGTGHARTFAIGVLLGIGSTLLMETALHGTCLP